MTLEGLECQAKEFGLDFGGSQEGRQLVWWFTDQAQIGPVFKCSLAIR